jgi:hypothetical protein
MRRISIYERVGGGLTKKTKEFWTIIGLTLLVPVLVICGLYALSWCIPPPHIDPIDGATIQNATHVTFIVATKYMYDDRVGAGADVDDYYFSNTSEFDTLEFKKQYTCNLTTYGWLINVTHSMSDCKENKDFNYTKLFKLGE